MKFVAVVMVVCALVLAGCGGGGSSSSTSNTVTITISPGAVVLGQNQSATFTATVTNSSNTNVNWQVNGVDGGNSSVGTITSAGVYTSPATVTTQFSVTVTAISQADTTKTASAGVTLTPPSKPPVSPIIVTPASAQLAAGAQQTFSATVTGTTTTVVWSVSCQSSNSADCGSVTQSGVYTAPLFPPPGGSALVTAETSDNSALAGNAPVTIQISNQSLFGQYAFESAGPSGSVAGSLSVDGQGNVTGGVEDIAGNGGASTAITGGNYHIGTDGRGSLAITTSAGSSKYQVVMTSRSHILLQSFDASDSGSTGNMDLQNTSQLTSGSFQGNYGFSFSGVSSANSSGSLRAAGSLTADGANAITSGMMDMNDTGTAQTALAVTGTFTAPSAQGRGLLTLTSSAGTRNFAYYLVDSTRLKIVEIDGTARDAGELIQLAGSNYTNASYNGSYVFAVGGSSTTGPVSTGGVLTLNGQGTVTGTIDTNNNGNVSAGQSINGTYSVTDAASGRATLSWSDANGAHQFVIYPAANNDVNVLQLDGMSAGGPGLYQRIAGFSNSTFSGNFAVQFSGMDFTGSSGAMSATGQIIPNGGSALSGVLDLNANGTLSAASSASGSYSFNASGRATLSLSTAAALLRSGQLGLYAADPNRAVFIGTDSNRVVSGVLQKQY